MEQVENHDIDKIVHAAVLTGVLPEVEASRSRSIVDINVMDTTNLLELARRVVSKRFLYVSSGSVYGNRPKQEEVLREDADLHPHTLTPSTNLPSTPVSCKPNGSVICTALPPSPLSSALSTVPWRGSPATGPTSPW